ncbi:MAG TPA: hypothetical protein VFB34_11475 [Chloroflexota bacterium]|nr:hypothetical protein [Chloroflexota bacterium]
MDGIDSATRLQLEALSQVATALAAAGFEYWVYGGWAVDLYAGRVTRPHFDVDFAVWLADLPGIRRLLQDLGFEHAPDPEEDGGTGFERAGVRLELTFLEPGEGGNVMIPMRQGLAVFSPGPIPYETRSLVGATCRVMGLQSLARGKSHPRDDPDDARKDRADNAVLQQLGIPSDS